MSISKDFAMSLAREIQNVNQELIQEVTRNNDLVNQIIKIYNLDEEELESEFTNTFSDSPNIACGYIYHEFDEDGCNEHYCSDCNYGDKEEHESPCSNCSNINASSEDCYYMSEDEEYDPRPIKSYDGIYEPIGYGYLEFHSANDCHHSISTCKNCEYRLVKKEVVPCIGCNCINQDSMTCFHKDNQN